ncbi:MAG: amidohydrolase family protein [Fimbriimonadaceae bacterium]|nr:amidohydrolase family protein [Fimbriimonadaceae bacterium]
MGDTAVILRPYGIIVSGVLEIGLEVVREGSRIVEIRPHTGIPDEYVLSVPFVNAHSHLEYRGLQGKIAENEFFAWIRKLTELKQSQSMEEVRAACLLAAEENKATGVGLIGEHSDRPFSGEALSKVGIGGIIFQEVITFLEHESPDEKWNAVSAKADINKASFEGQVVMSPHAIYTNEESTLVRFGESGEPFSIHIGETVYESQLTHDGTGPFAELARKFDVPVLHLGKTIFGTAEFLGLVRRGAQFVHCCDLSLPDIKKMSKAQVTVAHCPRSNLALQSPLAPIRELLDHGIDVGLGLDSAASSGAIDMFAEMRAALQVGGLRDKRLAHEEVWNMATTMGARSLWREGWDMQVGFDGPLIALDVADCHSTAELIEGASPRSVRWVH